MELKSNEEKYFSYYLEELITEGYVEKYEYEEEILPLTQGLKVSYDVEVPGKRKTTIKSKTVTILEPSEYTYDFKVYWTPKAIGVLYNDISHYKGKYFYGQNNISRIEIKGMFDRNNMLRLNKSTVKYAYDKLGIIVQLVQIPKLFKDTFTPRKYLITDKTGQLRKINFKTNNLYSYVDRCKN